MSSIPFWLRGLMGGGSGPGPAEAPTDDTSMFAPWLREDIATAQPPGLLGLATQAARLGVPNFPGGARAQAGVLARNPSIGRGVGTAGALAQGGLAAAGYGSFPVDIPEGLAPGRPDPVDALPPAANSLEEQIRASISGTGGRGSAQPPIPMRTDGSPMAAPAAPGAGRMRAIRLPNGQFLFTNRDEYGGEEFETKDAGDIGRASQMDPQSDTAKALIERARSSGRTRNVAGKDFDPSGATGFIEGTPEIRRELALDEALGAAALARAQSEREFAELPIERQAMVSNPDLVAGAAVTRDLEKRLNQARQEAVIAEQEISTPGHPKFIPDEAARRLALREIEERRDGAVQDALAVGSLMMGRSIPPRY